MKYKNSKNSGFILHHHGAGFSLVELIVALGIFGILAAGVFYVAGNSFSNFYGSGDKQQITQFTQEAIEAVKSIRDNSWQDIENIANQGSKGLTKNVAGYWEISGTSNISGDLTRVVGVTSIYRDASGNIVDSGGTLDPNTYKITATTTASGMEPYVLNTILTNWAYKSWSQTNWSGLDDREYWSDSSMASSSYSNVSTTTVNQLTLSQAAGPGAILGDWVNFATSSNYSITAWQPIQDFTVSPDGNTLYVIGNTNFDLRAYDVKNIRDGFFDYLWLDPMDISIHTMELDTTGKYAYIGNANLAQGGIAVEVLDLATQTVIDSETSDDPATGGNIRIMDLVINEAGDKLFAIDSHSGFRSYTINSDGTLTSDIVGGGGDANLIGSVFTLYGYTPHRIWLDESGATPYAYITTDYTSRAFTKFNISDPTAISHVYSYTGVGDCNGLEFIANSGSGNTFAVSCEDSASELKIFRDNGSSFDLLDTADPGTFNTSPGLIYDNDNTVIMYDTTSLNIVAYNVSDPANISQVFAPDTSTFGISYSTWPHHYLEYHEKIGGFFLTDWVLAGSTGFIDFTPRPETRNTGAGYDYKRTITLGLDSTVVSGPHSHFPVVVAETQDYLKTESNGGKVKNDYGYDIIFTSDSAGETILDHEIETYSSSTGEFIAWVDVPVLASNTDIYMFYGNTNIVTSQERPASVWDSNYKFVSHMANRHSYFADPGDSTIYKNHLTHYNNAVQSDGKIGRDFDSDGTGDYVYGAHNENLEMSTAFTWSAWVRIDGAGQDAINGLVAKQTSARIYSNTANPGTFSFQLYDTTPTAYTLGPANNFFTHGEWTRFDLTFDRPDIILYRNGQSLTTYSWDHDLTNLTSGSLMAGAIQSNAYFLNGHMDEIKLSNIARSPGWIETNYNNENSTSTFYEVGTESIAGGYNSPGYIYSSIFDLGSTDKELRSMVVEQNVPAGCGLSIDLEADTEATFTSPTVETFSDTSAGYYVSSTPATLNGKRYIRYKATLTACSSNANTPTLYSIKFNYR